MRSLFHFCRRFPLQIAFFASAIVTWPILAEYELFERFYSFSRRHEDWDLDEFALLIINLTVALTLSVLLQWRKLKRLVNEREDQRKRAESNARHDPLTGLMNRRAFTNALDGRSSDEGMRVVAMIDLDRFKPINDLHGHAAGDNTLQVFANRLKDVVAHDGIIARLGGDEFAIAFAASATTDLIERLAARLLGSMQNAIEFENSHFFVGCSIGLVQWLPDMESAEALRRADKALYTAKKAGRGQFAWYDGEMDRLSQERVQIEADLEEAIATSQIVPWFQPIVEIDTNRLTGFEILARWHHETRGYIPPDVFIPIAEDSGQIGRLGLAVLRQACASARDWDKQFSIALNVSPYQFHDPKLVDQIKEVLDECEFNPNRLVIEVTEGSVIHDLDTARNILVALKQIGVAIALDDFGTGYSSLASLRQLPFDRIKIDRSFITNIGNEWQNQKIVEGIMALASGLKLEVTAEGIETSEDQGFLQEVACSLGQGFHFEKALPAAQVSWLLESRWNNGVVSLEREDVNDQVSKTS